MRRLKSKRPVNLNLLSMECSKFGRCLVRGHDVWRFPLRQKTHKAVNSTSLALLAAMILPTQAIGQSQPVSPVTVTPQSLVPDRSESALQVSIP